MTEHEIRLIRLLREVTTTQPHDMDECYVDYLFHSAGIMNHPKVALLTYGQKDRDVHREAIEILGGDLFEMVFMAEAGR